MTARATAKTINDPMMYEKLNVAGESIGSSY
jgi:hypothetical protein